MAATSREYRKGSRRHSPGSEIHCDSLFIADLECPELVLEPFSAIAAAVGIFSPARKLSGSIDATLTA